MNYLYLRAFYAVATERSFTRAAQVLNVSQSTLSSHVKELEETYDIRLLDRRGRTVVPTDTGEAVLAQCREFFRHEEQIDGLLNRSQKLQAGRLKVGADGPKHVVSVLASFMELHPDFKVSLHTGNARNVTQDLLNYETDVAIVAALGAPHTQLYTEPWIRYALVAVIPRTHPLARKEAMDLTDFANERVIMREPTSLTRQLLTRSLERAGILVQNTMEMDSREAIREAVASGMGISVMSEIEFPNDDAHIAGIRINDPELQFTEYVACRENRKNTPSIKEFFRLAQSFRRL
ncbi:LysR substrate-binding domain-containing protein [Paraburkholderia aromaticivorans]|uniref:LysR substrate-binding domain-containing protein n=1 Tax=Paraburkholderia aromaticivorans TaxID=2026199 RepID=UPI001455F3FD|nr:LysR substrate-binding domain-containing protein [Paraburkholderia aromaticivorans]